MKKLNNYNNSESYPKLALVWINLMNYHLSRLRAIQSQLNGSCIGIELVGGYGDADYYGLPFRAQESEGLNIITLFPDKDLNEISPVQLSQKLLQTLQKIKPEYVALCGYHRVENLAALAWAKLTHRPVILMIESKQDDTLRQVVQEGIKSLLVRQFDSYLVGGIPHQQYMLSLGARHDRIFEGYDIVENHLFAEAAETARLNAKQLRAELNLPNQYFIVACRFVKKKNLFFLLEAYKLYYETHSSNSWGLVICGGGPLDAELHQFIEAKKIFNVHFPGFHKGRELGKYYGLASCLIHPSIQEQWGLVVNEAMAVGLPVLVSRTCGCVQNLVQEGVNGFTFDPTDMHTLVQLMSKMTQNSSQLKSMGASSQRIIKRYAPEMFAKNLILAMAAAKLPK